MPWITVIFSDKKYNSLFPLPQLTNICLLLLIVERIKHAIVYTEQVLFVTNTEFLITLFYKIPIKKQHNSVLCCRWKFYFNQTSVKIKNFAFSFTHWITEDFFHRLAGSIVHFYFSHPHSCHARMVEHIHIILQTLVLPSHSVRWVDNRNKAVIEYQDN